jgi:arylsulfatase A-like enzyme
MKVILCATVIVVAVGCAQPAPPPPPPPNIIIVVIDTLRADRLGQYGYGRATSPALADFAAKATMYRDCAAPAGWTNPSVASLFTGLHTARHRTNAFGAVLGEEHTTLAEVLRDGGWSTAAISFNPGVRSELNYDQGFEHFDEFLGKSSKYPHMEEMIDRAIEWIDDRPPGPFFLYLQPMNVHGPYRVPPEARTALLGQPPSNEFKYYAEPMKGILRRGELDLRKRVPDSYLESLNDKYDTAVRYSTDQLGAFFDLLIQRRLFDDALVIVTADHGEELFDHGGFSHGFSLHREVVHVPLFVKLPGQREAREVVDRVSLMDVMPTVLEVAGIDPVPGIDGGSLLAMHERESEEPAVRLSQTAWAARCVARGITSGRWRLLEIERNYERLQNVVRLYDVELDPGETRELSAEEPEVVAQLRRRLRRHFNELEGRAGQVPENRMDELDEDRLRALGYVE